MQELGGQRFRDIHPIHAVALDRAARADEGAEDRVPEREHAAVVAVVLARVRGVVEVVRGGADEEAGERAGGPVEARVLEGPSVCATRSVDLITTSSYRPIVPARVFDDRGASGTSGFTEELFDPSEALLPSETDSFSVPVDTTNFRMNLGVRTLDLPTTVRFTLVSAAGGTGSPVERTYLPNSFEQIGATVVLGPLFAGGAIRARIIEGSAFVYASTTDNRTNDSSAQFSRRE